MADLARVEPPSARLGDLIRDALRGRAAPWPALTAAEASNLAAHGIAPLLYAVARPPELRSQAIAAAAGEPLRLSDLQFVLGRLDAARIPTLIMKGSALAYDVYASPDHRPRADTDLLVPADRFDDAKRVLREAGFEELESSGDRHGMRQAAFRRTDPFGATHVYDVHWAALNSALFAEVIRQDRIVPRPLPRVGPAAATLPHVEALMLACLHRVVHHQDDERLMWLVDIALLRRAMSIDEHRRFWRLAAEQGVIAICRRSIDRADDWMGESGPTAEQFLSAAELERREPADALLGPSVTYGQWMLAELRALGWRARLVRLRQLAVPSRAYMRRSFPGRTRGQLPWLYLYRAGRSVRRLFRRRRDV